MTRAIVGEVDARNGDNAWVIPLFEVQEQWRACTDVLREFPTRGQVYWWCGDRRRKPEPGQIFVLSIEPNNRPGKPDDFVVGGDRGGVPEALDLRTLGSPARIRRSLEREVGPHVRSGAEQSTHLLADGALLGNVSLERTESGRLILGRRTELASVPLFEVPHGLHEHTDGLGRRRYLVEERALRLVGELDWRPDAKVILQLLSDATAWREFAERFVIAREHGGPTRAFKQGLMAAVERLPKGDVIAQQRAERALDAVSSPHDPDELALELWQELRKLPEVVSLLEQARSEAREELIRMRSDLLQKRDHLLAEIKALEAKEKKARKQLKAQAKAVEELEKGWARKQEEVLARVRLRLQDEVSALGDALAISQLLPDRQLSRMVSAPDQSSGETPPEIGEESTAAGAPLPWDVGREEGATITSRAAITGHLWGRSALKRIQQWTLAAWLAGRCPVLSGSAAAEFLMDVGHAFFGGRVLVVPVTPTVLEPSDLLIRTHPESQNARPTAILSALSWALANPDKYVLLVLDGVNRSATEAYLLPLLRCVANPRFSLQLPQPTSQLVGRQAHSVQWAPNLLVAGTLAEGPTTLAVSTDLWRYAALVDLDERPYPRQEPQPGTIARSLFAALSGELPATARSAAELDLPDWASPYSERASELATALSVLGVDGSRRMTFSVLSILLPLVPSLFEPGEVAGALAEIEQTIGPEANGKLVELYPRLARRLVP